MSEPNAGQLAEWEAWCDERPPDVAAVARAHPPWRMYRVKDTGQYCVVRSYQEAEENPAPDSMFATVTLNIFAWYDWSGPALGHGVFGVKPENLEPADA